jgi:hypothetical protein
MSLDCELEPHCGRFRVCKQVQVLWEFWVDAADVSATYSCVCPSTTREFTCCFNLRHALGQVDSRTERPHRSLAFKLHHQVDPIIHPSIHYFLRPFNNRIVFLVLSALGAPKAGVQHGYDTSIGSDAGFGLCFIPAKSAQSTATLGSTRSTGQRYILQACKRSLCPAN